MERLQQPQKIQAHRSAHHEPMIARGHVDLHRIPHAPSWMGPRWSPRRSAAAGRWNPRRSAAPGPASCSTAVGRENAPRLGHQGAATWHLAIGAETRRGQALLAAPRGREGAAGWLGAENEGRSSGTEMEAVGGCGWWIGLG